MSNGQAPMQKPKRQPNFNAATRKLYIPLPAQQFVAGQALRFRMPKVGFLKNIYLFVRGTMTVTPGTGTAAISSKGPWNLLSWLSLKAGQGTPVYDTSGYGNYLVNLLDHYLGDPAYDGSAARSYATNVYSAGAASGANTWNLPYKIPVMVNEKDPVGLILLQTDNTDIVLEVKCNNPGGADEMIYPVKLTGDAAATFAGTVYCVVEVLSVPKEKIDWPNVLTIHQWLETQLAISGAGPNVVNLYRGNTYMQIIHSLEINGALNTNAVDNLALQYNEADKPVDLPGFAQLAIQRARYGRDLPLGTFIHDLYFSAGLVNLGNARDFVNSRNVTELKSVITIANGTVFGAGNNYIRTLTRQLVELQ